MWFYSINVKIIIILAPSVAENGKSPEKNEEEVKEEPVQNNSPTVNEPVNDENKEPTITQNVEEKSEVEGQKSRSVSPAK